MEYSFRLVTENLESRDIFWGKGVREEGWERRIGRGELGGGG